MWGGGQGISYKNPSPIGNIPRIFLPKFCLGAAKALPKLPFPATRCCRCLELLPARFSPIYLVILIDHQSIQYMCDIIYLRGKKGRWIELTHDFNFKLHFKGECISVHRFDLQVLDEPVQGWPSFWYLLAGGQGWELSWHWSNLSNCTAFYTGTYLRILCECHDYVVECQTCQINKVEPLCTIGLLHPLAIPKNKWESIPWILLWVY